MTTFGRNTGTLQLKPGSMVRHRGLYLVPRPEPRRSAAQFRADNVYAAVALAATALVMITSM